MMQKNKTSFSEERHDETSDRIVKFLTTCDARALNGKKPSVWVKCQDCGGIMGTRKEVGRRRTCRECLQKKATEIAKSGGIA